MKTWITRAWLGGIVVVLAGCSAASPQALGALEYDRITLPAPAAERIVAEGVRPGQRVQAGQVLLRLDPAHTQAQLAAAQAQAAQAQAALSEALHGPRPEDIAKARADLAAAQALAKQAHDQLVRLLPLGRKSYVSAAAVDQARASANDAYGKVDAAKSALDELLHGTRPEQIAQARASLAGAQAQAQAARVLLGKLDIVAPRAGIIDSVPYKRGDQAPVGGPLAIELVGAAPYARIYVTEKERAHLRVGDRVDVSVLGRKQIYAGRVRMLRSEPAFTPYYALAGDDASRLSYLAEVALGKDAASLPAGLPVHVHFSGMQP